MITAALLASYAIMSWGFYRLAANEAAIRDLAAGVGRRR